MKISSAIKLKYGSIRKCAMQSGIPYTTLTDVCNEKTDLMNCSCSTAWKLAKALGITVDELLSEGSFRWFRDELHRKLKDKGEVPFLVEVMKQKEIERLWDRGQISRALYLLAMSVYLCYNRTVHQIPESMAIIEKRDCFDSITIMNRSGEILFDSVSSE